MLDWLDDDDAGTVQAIIELAIELLDTITECADNPPPVEFPVELTVRAADHISDGADVVQVHKTYDACADEYDDAAILLVAEMRKTARALLKAARSA